MSDDIESPKVFISYSHADTAFATMLTSSLREEQFQVWIDRDDIEIGESIVLEMQRGISESNFLVFILSPDAVLSRWVEQELSACLMRSVEKRGLSILPIMCRQCVSIPPFLSHLRIADFTGSFIPAFDLLIRSIKSTPRPLSSSSRNLSDSRFIVSHQNPENWFTCVLYGNRPVWSFSLSNRSGTHQVINRVEAEVIEYNPFLGMASPAILMPLATWSINLSFDLGVSTLIPRRPLLVPDGSAASVRIRFSAQNRNPRRVANFRLIVRFLTDGGPIAESQSFAL